MVDRETGLRELWERGIFEVGEVTKFKVYRPDGSGAQRLVTVEVWDRGPRSDGERYYVVACDDDGREASGNGHDDLILALHSVHWRDLDRDSA